MLADAWDRNRAGRVKTRVESLGALQDQSRVLGGNRKSFRVSGTRQTVKMRRLPTEYEDRKSTRLNSSHVANSYAVCCLKKKRTSDAPPGDVGGVTGRS